MHRGWSTRFIIDLLGIFPMCLYMFDMSNGSVQNSLREQNKIRRNQDAVRAAYYKNGPSLIGINCFCIINVMVVKLLLNCKLIYV